MTEEYIFMREVIAGYLVAQPLITLSQVLSKLQTEYASTQLEDEDMLAEIYFTIK